MDLKQTNWCHDFKQLQTTWFHEPVGTCVMCDTGSFTAHASSLGGKPKHTHSERFYKSVITLQQFGARLEAEDCNLHSSVSEAICVAALVVCVTSVLCPGGWCCIHLSVTQKQMSPGRWGAVDCRGDQAVAGWRCLRPAGPSRWKLRSLSAVLFVALFPPRPMPSHFLTASVYCKDTPGQSPCACH